MEMQLTAISVLAELERIGWQFEPAGGDELRVCCPAHQEKRPSCAVNVVKRMWKCQSAGCGRSGDIVTFVALALSQASGTVITRGTVWADMVERYGISTDKTVDMGVIERNHDAIWACPILQELYDRGLSDDTIRERRLGFDRGRIQIPVFNQAGQVVNVRQYLPGAPGPQKMRNLRGHGSPRLYPLDQLRFDQVVVTGGECKALVLAQHLNAHGVGSVCLTAGEGEGWTDDTLNKLRGKRVYSCFDVDVGGRKASGSFCAQVNSRAGWVGDVVLDLDAERFPKGDPNDYFGVLKRTADDFLRLLADTAKWEPPVERAEPDAPATRVHLSQAASSRNASRRISLRATVAAMDTTPYLVPKSIRCTCTRDQQQCAQCPIYAQQPDENGAVTREIGAESPALLQMIATTRKGQKQSITEGLRMPACKVVHFKVTEFYNVEDVRLSPQLEMSSRAADHVVQPCMYVGQGLETNSSYDLEGRVFPHPETQQAVLLASRATPAEDALASYKPDADQLDALGAFQPDEWTLESLTARLGSIYVDLAANVTNIYQRPDLHLAFDLAYHSVLLFNFDGRQTKGWVEVLIAGDSSQGKSETLIRLMGHYGLGERVDCKNATVAGLLGGLQPMGNRWMVSWGVIPQHDKRFVALEELKGATTEVIGKLTDMRSSGVAELPKIEKRRAHARTRLAAVSNPRGDRPLKRYNFGIEAIVELIGGLEDIRRFDFCYLVAGSQVDATEINRLQRDRPAVPKTYTPELCRRLVLWAWTRTEPQVTFEPDASDAILAAAIQMCAEFTEIVPIVDRGSMRYKLARLSIALACRTFSCLDDDQEVVVVRRCHVEYVVEFLRRTYSDPVFGYKDYSDAVKMAEAVVDPGLVKRKILETPFPKDFVEQMIHRNEIEPRDIGDWCGWDRGDAINLLSFLVRKHALQRDGRSYRKTSSFIDLLKELRGSKEMKEMERPDYIEESGNQY
jgi:hypothetical protein